ncbi:hypothetical protein BDQ94DRAFT_77747 [Aspergillus welwitschiae]|uniref:Uncharacterized protein n=1 Tax=Aspergillus welwitschiae TaxID=1341132 RepID=A0A3F3PTD7_9EURO|nr:hypothetical protein BDQ94DRAFT_77747 [Aspergillus welwitschiae]RDH30230.1 hypothetical protein BDQ94DRAFT_77747 [Aspergillus welwitschiae]
MGATATVRPGKAEGIPGGRFQRQRAWFWPPPCPTLASASCIAGIACLGFVAPGRGSSRRPINDTFSLALSFFACDEPHAVRTES